MKFIRYILIILVPVYFLVVWLRNKLFDWGILKSEKYEFPVICVGNLNVGGTGKTPMIEYLIRLLSDEFKVATLSRGYKRKSSGFVLAGPEASAESIGDEPFQFYRKFREIYVAVDGNRRRGIASLRSLPDPPQLILLDDAFQHRNVKAGLNVLLTKYGDLFVDDILLPTGNLREPISGRKRADMVVVTKCPPGISLEERRLIRERLRLDPSQQLTFSSIRYSEEIKSRTDSKPISILSSLKFILLTGIADATELRNYLAGSGFKFDHMEFADHHEFSAAEIDSFSRKELILTTEKDYVRLLQKYQADNIWYLPIEVEFHGRDSFNSKILEFVSD